jgi:hypothetical protein
MNNFQIKCNSKVLGSNIFTNKTISRGIIFMKSILVGIGTFIFGYILVSIFTSIYNGSSAELAYYNAIMVAILFLSAVVGVATSLILIELRKN